MHRLRLVPVLSLCFACAVGSFVTTAPAAPLELPRMHLTWRAPWGEPGATTDIVADCRDTTRADTLYLTFDAPPHLLPLTGMTATLLVEPADGDTLARYWFVERGDVNAGAMLVDFDFLGDGTCRSPWSALVAGNVGYTRAAGRGRLDISADVPTERRVNLFPGTCYIWARIAIRHTLAAGCSRPVRLTWIGGRIRSTRPKAQSVTYGVGPGRSVTWNAPRAGISRRHTGLAIETYVPRRAPPSRAALVARQAASPAIGDPHP